jgi:transposase
VRRRHRHGPTRRRAEGGWRIPDTVPCARWHRLTLLGALTFGGLAACLAIPDAADTDAMAAFVEPVLAPALRPGQVVVPDNLSVPRAPVVRRLVGAAGCTLRFLPPHSPDLNRVEPAWSKPKGRLRSAAARTTGALYDALAGAVGAVTADDARG